MRKIATVMVAGWLAMSAAGAWAADVEGKVQSVDTSERVVMLDDGTKLHVAEGVSLESIKEGDEVKASYEERDGKNVATSIKVSE